MFLKRKNKRISGAQKDENTWRLENEIYRKIHDLEKSFKLLEETKEKGKREKNPNLQQFIANEYLKIENKIKIQSMALKEMQKTFLENQSYLDQEELLSTYKYIDNHAIANVHDLKKMVVKIRDIQETKQEEDKERKEINDIFNDSMEVYGSSLENDRVKSLTEMWASENEAEELSGQAKQEESSEALLEESKGEL